MTSKPPIEKLMYAADAERLHSDLTNVLSEPPFSRLQEWAESLTELAEYVDEASSSIEEWSYAETRDDKADAKERALEALNNLITTWEGSPLDIATLQDYEPPAD